MTDITERLEAEGIMFAEERFPEAAALLLDARDEIVLLRRDAWLLQVAIATLEQIATTPRNAGARINANGTLRFIQTQQGAAMAASGGEET